MKGNIRENLNRVLDNIREAELRSGRKEGSVQLVAVSKFHPVSAVVEAYEAGQRIFGENRVQEAVEKFSKIGKNGIELHLIGSLQRNKVGKILPYVSCIQSVDRIELVMEIERKLSSNSDDQGKTFQNVLMEIHTGEESKSGYTSEKDLFDSIDYALKSGKVRIQGLMTMAPFTEDENLIRASFKKLIALQHQVVSRYPGLQLPVISMGMSNDYKIAIEEGSTMVRIGTAIFGTRE